MTRKEARTKRKELLMQARRAEINGGIDARAIAERCRTMASNLLLAASANEADAARGRALYDKSRADFDQWAAHREGAGQ